ncbi:MAG TPA: leucine--tRNA ligase, partial [Firmicutes bacterium]|nr:leucine--tRNA ligase [Bacillota bacterium]
PMGYDAFGLPAENAAIKNNIHPAKWTRKNIEHARGQFEKLGMSYDWDRELATCDESYYRWNQWLFIKFFKKGLAYKKDSSVNWCESCDTVLANEQVHEGRCWRCENEVVQKNLAQWFFKTTAYSQELLDGHNDIEWPERVLAMQRNWIGKSTGVTIYFKEMSTEKQIPVFTTRPDTIFGATYVVLAAEHPMTEEIIKMVPEDKKREIEKFREKCRKIDKTVETMLHIEKEGLDTGIFAVNPVNGKQIPIFIGNYVLMDYGTGAIMAVPTHDSRDFQFAKKYNLEMVVVIEPSGGKLDTGEMQDAHEGSGVLVNSGGFNGLDNTEAIEKIADWMEKEGIGKKSVNYKFKDWLLSRQRYWGTPIPAVYCDKCGIVMEKEENLPVKLPEDIEFTGKGNPLETSKSFLAAECPKCGGSARRETDTMDTFVDSSWYFIRYCDAKNETECISRDKADRELAVDQYVGGPEHACMHLIYARFFTKVMRDMGLISIDEPFKRLLTQGMVVKDGNKMSKSKGNTVSPDDMVEKYGSDTARLFMLFAAPPPADLEWSDRGVEGASRFLKKVWKLLGGYADKIKSENSAESLFNIDKLSPELKQLARKTHQTIKKVSVDVGEIQQFNTAVAALMELYNLANKNRISESTKDSEELKMMRFFTENFIKLLAPFAPHFSEEIWSRMGNTQSIFRSKWPEYDESLTAEDTIEFVVQVMGRIRAKFSVVPGISREKAEEMAFADEKVKEYTDEKEIVKIIFVPDKLLNIVVK